MKSPNVGAVIWGMLRVIDKRFGRLKSPELMKDAYQEPGMSMESQ